jgi:hypothetical protein
MILPKQNFNVEIINKRFVHSYFRDKALPSGNVIVFTGNVNPGKGYDFSQFGIDEMQEALNIVYENPLVHDSVSGALFSHFLVSSIANVLSQEFLKIPLAVNMDNIIVNREFKRKGLIQNQGVLNIARYRILNGCGLGHIALCNIAGENSPAYTYEMNLNEEQMNKLSQTIVDMFYKITDSVFLKSTAC